jgi:hypothetical protein
MAKLIYPLYPGPTTTNERYYISMFVFVLFALILFIANARRTIKTFSNMALIPLAAGCGVQILSYTTTAYGGVKEWYWAGQMVLIVLAGSVLLELILRCLQHLPFQKGVGTMWRVAPGKIKPIRVKIEFASIVLAIFLAYEFGFMVAYSMRYNYYPADPSYRKILPILPYLEENTSPGSIIGMTGGGIAGYYIHDRTIINLDGLINSYDYFRSLQNKEAPEFLRKRGMTIVFANTHLIGLPPYFGQFDPYLESYSVYGGKSLLYLLEKRKY